jgi:hypothetical protein
LADSSKGVVGAALRKIRSTEWEADLIKGFEPVGMIWIPPGNIASACGEYAVDGFYVDKFPGEGRILGS